MGDGRFFILNMKSPDGNRCVRQDFLILYITYSFSVIAMILW